MEKKEAYQILGLSEGASKEQIQKKYNVLIKRYRMSSSDSGEKSPEIDMERVDMAYNLLMGYIVEEPSESRPYKPNPILQKMGVDEKKAKNFLYYYKFHIIGAIILVILAVFFIKDVVFRVPSDLDAAFVGEIYYSDTELFKQNVMSKMPELREMSIDAAIFAEGMDAQMEYAMNMKTVVLFGGGTVDIFLLDKASYEKFGSQGAFENLDNIAGKLKIDEEKSKDLLLKTEEDPEEHLYGIDVSDSKLLKESGIIGERIIAAIRVNAKHHENALRMLELLLE
ncbi:MAG TPA: hypothetical protein GXX14_12620 [Clostridiaceae bacterium]|nr:hypothetical protein [Clostridiaceae bacterium]